MTDARVPFRATMPVQIGPRHGGDSLLEVRVRPIALQGIVRLVELASSVRTFFVGRNTRLLVYSVVGFGKCGRLSWKQQVWS